MSAAERRAAAIAALNALEAADFAPVLDSAAEHCARAGAELANAWQDAAPGRLWTRVARALELAAGQIAKVAS